MIFYILPVVAIVLGVAFGDGSLPDQRPPVYKRTFRSSVIDNLIASIQPLFLDPNVGTLFSNCLPNTLDTTVFSYTTNPSTVPTADLDSFIITGDIDALWLRDSMNQVLPYIPYSTQDQSLQYLLEGLINRHARSVIIDPFANSFNFNASGAGHQSDQRIPPMTKSVFEGKYEIDSLAAFLKLSYWYQRYNTENGALFRFADDRWLSAVESLLNTVQTMQFDTGRLSSPPYLFRRVTSEALDTLAIQGRGPPSNPNGLTRSLFRPSDDAVTLPYNIPGNAMICVELNHLEEMLSSLVATKQKSSAEDLLDKTRSIRSALCGALLEVSRASDEKFDSVLPYEVDGFGGNFFMDDANVPSLLSLPVLGYLSKDNPIYQATRDFVLSTENPFFFSGSVADGIGGPHVGFNYSWPMAIAMRGMTASDESEILACVNTLAATTAGTGLMHESFNVNDANDFTRSWFAWANGVFGDFILQILYTKPHLLINQSDPQALDTVKQLVRPPIAFVTLSEPLYN